MSARKVDVRAWLEAQVAATAGGSPDSLTAAQHEQAKQASTAIVEALKAAEVAALAATPRHDSARFYEVEGRYILDLREALHRVKP